MLEDDAIGLNPEVLENTASGLSEMTLDVDLYMGAGGYSQAWVEKRMVGWSRREAHAVATMGLRQFGKSFRSSFVSLRPSEDINDKYEGVISACDAIYTKGKTLIKLLRAVDVLETVKGEKQAQEAEILYGRYENDTAIPRCVLDKLKGQASSTKASRPKKKQKVV